MTNSRLVIVSNRLPLTAQVNASGIHRVSSGGGLATGLGAWHRDSGGVWCGWPGDVSEATAEQRAVFDTDLERDGFAPVHLSPDEVTGYYDGFANRVLWPLFHYLTDRVPVDAAGWDAYCAANQRFADVVAHHCRPDDTIWVHDYHLMLLPRLLRERLPAARIGFFLHIPFPTSEVFRVLPWRHALLDGLLGADVIGFHTFAYLRHFMASLLHVDGLEAEIDRVNVDGREVRVGVYPMGIDGAAFDACARSTEIEARAAQIRQDAGGRQIVLGVDRLDYTKGIPRRLEAIERLLARDPELCDRLRYIQIAIPSRGDVDAYRGFRREIEEQVGRINGSYGSLRSLPVHYVHQSVGMPDLVALYRAADVMLVTPLRDGMNLVAKEFAASRVDDDGVLILSEFAGAAAELHGAVTVNPYDIDGVADALRAALAMTPDERRARMRTLRRRVLEHDVHAWARHMVQDIQAAAVPRLMSRRSDPPLEVALAAARRAGPVRLLVDYDGTLVPLARAPHLAQPDPDLLELLNELSMTPGVTLDIVSGRPHTTLQEWFGDLAATLWAEHGFWCRPARGVGWQAAMPIAPDWMSRLMPILDRFVSSTPGSHVEMKTASLAWHYREAPRDFGARQAHELRMLLGDLLSNQPLEVLEGKKVIEVRLRGIGKGHVGQRVVAEIEEGSTILAIGDDLTDEELFRTLPPSAVTVAVNRHRSAARYVVPDCRAVRRLLRTLQMVDEVPSIAPRGPAVVSMTA